MLFFFLIYKAVDLLETLKFLNFATLEQSSFGKESIKKIKEFIHFYTYLPFYEWL